LPGVDAIFIGPNDLRFQMRAPDGTFPTNEQHEALVQRVIEVGKKVKCPTGIHSFDPKDALQRAEQGMRFIAIGSDLRFMSQRAAEVLDVVKPQKEKKEIVKY
jgi:4-hydroxy-2-oxoheptanedioate aldolase